MPLRERRGEAWQRLVAANKAAVPGLRRGDRSPGPAALSASRRSPIRPNVSPSSADEVARPGMMRRSRRGGSCSPTTRPWRAGAPQLDRLATCSGKVRRGEAGTGCRQPAARRLDPGVLRNRRPVVSRSSRRRLPASCGRWTSSRPCPGWSISTYATWSVRQAIHAGSSPTRSHHGAASMPRMTTPWQSYGTSPRRFQTRGREATTRLADLSGLSCVAKTIIARMSRRPVSLDQPLGRRRPASADFWWKPPGRTTASGP